MQMIENRMVVDSEWESIETEEIPKGQFDRWGGFVYQDYLLEVAIEQVVNDPTARASFLDVLFDYIEEREDAKEKFMKWFYPAYGEEEHNDK